MINQIFALLIIYPGHGSEQIVPASENAFFSTIDIEIWLPKFRTLYWKQIFNKSLKILWQIFNHHLYLLKIQLLRYSISYSIFKVMQKCICL